MARKIFRVIQKIFQSSPFSFIRSHSTEMAEKDNLTEMFARISDRFFQLYRRILYLTFSPDFCRNFFDRLLRISLQKDASSLIWNRFLLLMCSLRTAHLVILLLFGSKFNTVQRILLYEYSYLSEGNSSRI